MVCIKAYIFNNFYQQYLVLLTMVPRNRANGSSGKLQFLMGLESSAGASYGSFGGSFSGGRFFGGRFPGSLQEMRSLPRASTTRPWGPLSFNYIHLVPKHVACLYSFQWLPRASTCFSNYSCNSSVFYDKRETE